MCVCVCLSVCLPAYLTLCLFNLRAYTSLFTCTHFFFFSFSATCGSNHSPKERVALSGSQCGQLMTEIRVPIFCDIDRLPLSANIVTAPLPSLAFVPKGHHSAFLPRASESRVDEQTHKKHVCYNFQQSLDRRRSQGSKALLI